MSEATRDSGFVADVATDIAGWHHAVNPQVERLLESTGLAAWPMEPAVAAGAVLLPAQWAARLAMRFEELLAMQAALATAWFTPAAWLEAPTSPSGIAARMRDATMAAVDLWAAFLPVPGYSGRRR